MKTEPAAYSSTMSIFRALCIYLLILAVPVQSWASVAMTHCKDVPAQSVEPQAAAPHDHAAMMRQTAFATSEDHSQHAHHAMSDETGNDYKQISAATESDDSAKALDCDCGCDCSGNCAMTCAASVVSLFGSNSHTMYDPVALHAVPLRSRAQPAHRFTPLRPPSAAAT